MSMIHAFSSTNGSGLHAFTDDARGTRLPTRHGPWKHTMGVPVGRALPHGIDRRTIQAAIEEHGFQMWRPRKTEG